MISASEARWPHCDTPIELLDPAQMAEADRIAAQTISSAALMQRAGEAIAGLALRRLDPRRAGRVVILCGPGNNGGDGYVAARLLSEAGVQVRTATLGDPEKLRGDAAAAFRAWTSAGASERRSLADVSLDAADLVIDALFGAGLARELDGEAEATVERVNAWRRSTGGPVVAVDVPSGVDGATGRIRGTAIEASDTVTFFRLKPGHLVMPGRVKCGRLELADIGIEASVLDHIKPKAFLNTPRLWGAHFPVPSIEGHKYGRGHAMVVSGPLSQTGAARLCARGALRAGAGLVTVATPAEALPVHAVALTAVMTRVADTAQDLRDVLADSRKNAVAMGPGLGVGDGTRALVAAAVEQGAAKTPKRHWVLDADALTSFADAPQALFDLIARQDQAVVLTPHDGEFSKLFGAVVDTSLPKLERTRLAAQKIGAIIVLKGADTVVADPDGRAVIAASDAPWLATAGSGDVLCGIIAGLLAQAMPAFEAAAASVWLHAEAARRHGPGLISEDLPDLLPPVLAELIGTGTEKVRDDLN